MHITPNWKHYHLSLLKKKKKHLVFAIMCSIPLSANILFSASPMLPGYCGLVHTEQKKIMIIICCVILGVVIASVVGGTLG